MQDILDICQGHCEPRLPGCELFLATVVQVCGPAYRHPGSHLLFSQEGPIAGAVSGGCLEHEIVRSSAWAVRNGPVVRSFDAGSEEHPAGGRSSGCGGVVDILIERLDITDKADPVSFMRHCLDHESSGVIATVYRSQTADVAIGSRLLYSPNAGLFAAGVNSKPLARELLERAKLALQAGKAHSYHSQHAGCDVLVEVVQPPPHLFVFGSGSDVLPIVKLANLLRWNVTVVSRAARTGVRGRFCGLARLIEGTPDSALKELSRCARPIAIVASHDLENDAAALRALLTSKAMYIGALGPKLRTERILNGLGVSDAVPLGLKRLHAPCGLHLGGESAAEIALSVIAEVQTVLNAASREHLRDRRRIHETGRVGSGLEPSVALDIHAGAASNAV